MLRRLKDVFSTIAMYILSTMVTPNILDYIKVLLKFFLLLEIYRQRLDYPNITYIVSPIRKIGFKNLDFLISSEAAIGKIPNIMIFVNKIDIIILITKY